MPGKVNIASIGRKALAASSLAASIVAIFLANTARVAETPAAGAGAGLARFGPGALGTIRFELAKLGVAKPELDQATARRALESAPLLSDPLTALAYLELEGDPQGRSGNAGALLVEAARRDPRGRAARFLRLRQLAANGDLKAAFTELATLQRLSPALVEILMKAIAQRISTPRQVDQALAAISGHNQLYLPLVAGLGSKTQSAEVISRFADQLPANVLDNHNVRKILIARLVEVGAFDRARTLWLRGNPVGKAGLVYSPDFSDTAAPPPFNWLYFVNTSGAAERGNDGRVSVLYYDRAPGPLMAQLLTLSPAPYRAQIEFRVESGTADNVRLRVSCRGSNALLGDLPLVKGKPSEMLFTVPGQGCSAQDLAIVGFASQQRGETHLTISRIDVARAGGQ